MYRRISQKSVGGTGHVSHADATAWTPYPKIVALWGASTKLGSELLLELAHSDQVKRVYVVATENIPVLSRLEMPILNKINVRIINPEQPDTSLDAISQCDLAFCVMTTERDASASMPSSEFRAINYVAPTRFIKRVIELGVLHISILSHYGADSDSRSTFCAAKGDLEKFVYKHRREAGDFSPMMTLYKMPSNIMASRSSRSRSASRDRVNNENHSPVDVSQVATVMLTDGFGKASIKGRPGQRRTKNYFQVFETEDVHRVLSESAGQGGTWTGAM